MAELPQLETERLVLRPPTLADLGPLHEVWGDRDVMRYVGAGKRTRKTWTRASSGSRGCSATTNGTVSASGS